MKDRKFRAARSWSNKELRKYAGDFSGKIVNVSAWKDCDKEGSTYKSYFTKADSYAITNYGGNMGRSGGIGIQEYDLDLTKPLDKELYQRFDVVFNHTTLEHVFDNRIAFKNLCDLGKEAVIVVVPWLQQVHVVPDGFSDYWRYSPFAMEKLYDENGYNMVVCTYNNERNTSVYLFCIGIRKEKMDKYPKYHKIELNNDEPAGRWVGDLNILEKIKNRIHIFRFKQGNIRR